MPVLTATITALGLYGGPEAANPVYTGKVPLASSRTYTEDFTALGLLGVSWTPDGPFTGKSESLTEDKFVSVNIFPRVTLGDVGDVDIDTTVRITPQLSIDAFAGLASTVSDSLVPRLTVSIASLVKSGTISKTASDSVVPRLSESASIVVRIGGTDTVIPVLTESASVNKADAQTLSETIVPVLRVSYLLESIVANVNWPRGDTILPVLTASASVRTAGEVDSIRINFNPYGRIRITKV